MLNKKTDPALVILTISDLHGQLEPTYTWGNDGELKQVGGISRIAGHINNIKKLYPEKVLVFGSGDFFIEDFNSYCMGNL
jgi:2',3'-cyclic-nucleotide 2'-phosphodiesterase (5'-nucleotidase family)